MVIKRDVEVFWGLRFLIVVACLSVASAEALVAMVVYWSGSTLLFGAVLVVSAGYDIQLLSKAIGDWRWAGGVGR
jgi:hypothetical protein